MSSVVKAKPTLANLDARVTALEHIATDIGKIKGLIKWIGPGIIGALLANGKIGEGGAAFLGSIFTHLFGV